MIIFNYWLKRYVKHFLGIAIILVVVLIVLSLPEFLDNWGEWFDAITTIKLILAPVLFKYLVVLLPLAASMSYIITVHHFIDSNEWICMRMYGISMWHYVTQGCYLVVGITVLIGSLIFIVTPVVNAHLTKLVSVAKMPNKYQVLLGGKHNIVVAGKSILVQKDQLFKDRYIFGDTVFNKKDGDSFQLLLATSNPEHNKSGLEMSSGVMYHFVLPKGDFQKMVFKKIYGRIRLDDGKSVRKMISRIGNVGWAGNDWDKILFTVLLMVWIVCYTPFLLQFGQYQAGFILVLVFGLYLQALRALGGGARVNWLVHLSFFGFILLCGILLRFYRLYSNRTGSVL